ncbi:MAG: hypothetical protein LBM64_01145 [Deltaproteobacteria bacterium]|jgi:hypothetical protein|nr:hypothetical protein [Deltaproteobacteria bacterium]
MNYSLTFSNNSDRPGIICLYLRPDGQDGGDAPLSLAWRTALVPLGGQAEFSWQANYAFAWAESGKLAPGSVFEAVQMLPTDPARPRKSAIALNYRWGAYTFEPTERRADEGALCIFSEAAVPEGLAAVGICLAGKPALAWNTMPNHRFIFRPSYRCWAAFGDFEPGEVLDVNRLSGAHEARFPAAGGALSLVLEQDGSWTEG